MGIGRPVTLYDESWSFCDIQWEFIMNFCLRMKQSFCNNQWVGQWVMLQIFFEDSVNEPPKYLIGHAEDVLSRVGGLVTESLDLVRHVSRLSIDPPRTLSTR